MTADRGEGPAPDKREVILDAALDLFAEQGYAATAVPALAERAGVGAGTIYRYFESKEGVVNALYRTWRERLARQVLDGFPDAAPPREQLELFCRRLASFAGEHPRAFAFLELHHHKPYVDERSLAPDERLRELALELIERHQRAGELKEDVPAEVLAAVIHGSCSALLRAAQAGRATVDEETLGHLVDCLWDAVRG